MERLASLPLYFVLLLASQAFAQTKKEELFSVMSVAPTAMTPKESTFYSKASQQKYAKVAHLIKVGNLARLQKDGAVDFSLPGFPKRLKAKTTRMETYSLRDYQWFAKLDDETDSTLIGNVVLISEKGNVYGQITVEDRVYEIRSDEAGITVMIEVDNGKFPKGADCKAIDPNSISAGKNRIKTGQANSGRIDPCPDPTIVLVAVTRRAREGNINVNQTINTAVAQYNAAVFDSGISSSAAITAVIRDVAFEETVVGGPIIPAPIETDIGRLIGDPAIWALKTDPAIQADLVMLITNGNYGNSSFAFGIAFLDVARNTPIPLLIDARAFAISEEGTAANRFTFAHELGHLFGGDHEQDNTFSEPYAHGHYFERRVFLGTRRRYATLMHTFPAGVNYSRIQRFSNPNLTYDGVATGNDRGNVARRMNETGSWVRTFRPGPNNISAYIQGGQTVFNGANVYEAVVSCGQAPYTYNWAVSYDGFSFGSAVSTAETYTYYYYPGATLIRQIRLQVTAADGRQTTSFLNINGASGRVGGKVASTPTVPTLLDAYPNPFSENTIIEFFLPATMNTSLKVTDMVGRTVQILVNGQLPAGKHYQTLSLQSLPEGMYHYTLQCGGFKETKRMVHVK